MFLAYDLLEPGRRSMEFRARHPCTPQTVRDRSLFADRRSSVTHLDTLAEWHHRLFLARSRGADAKPPRSAAWNRPYQGNGRILKWKIDP